MLNDPLYNKMNTVILKSLSDFRISVGRRELLILEVGAGTGILTRRIAEHLSSVRIQAIEPDREWFSCLKQRVGNLKKVETKNIDLGMLRARRNTFDVVVFSFSFHHFSPSQRVSALRKARRLLKNDGLLLVGEEFIPDPRDVRDVAESLGLSKRLRSHWETARMRQLSHMVYHGFIIAVDRLERRRAHREKKFSQARDFEVAERVELSALKEGIKARGEYKMSSLEFQGIAFRSDLSLKRQTRVGPDSLDVVLSDGTTVTSSVVALELSRMIRENGLLTDQGLRENEWNLIKQCLSRLDELHWGVFVLECTPSKRYFIDTVSGDSDVLKERMSSVWAHLDALLSSRETTPLALASMLTTWIPVIFEPDFVICAIDLNHKHFPKLIGNAHPKILESLRLKIAGKMLGRFQKYKIPAGLINESRLQGLNIRSIQSFPLEMKLRGANGNAKLVLALPYNADEWNEKGEFSAIFGEKILDQIGNFLERNEHYSKVSLGQRQFVHCAKDDALESNTVAHRIKTRKSSSHPVVTEQAVRRLEDQTIGILSLLGGKEREEASAKQVWTLRFLNGGNGNGSSKSDTAVLRYFNCWHSGLNPQFRDEVFFSKDKKYQLLKSSLSDADQRAHLEAYYEDLMYGLEYPARKGISGTVTVSYHPELVVNYRSDPRVRAYLAGERRPASKYGIALLESFFFDDRRDYLSIPILLGNLFWGLLLVFHGPKRTESELECSFIQNENKRFRVRTHELSILDKDDGESYFARVREILLNAHMAFRNLEDAAVFDALEEALNIFKRPSLPIESKIELLNQSWKSNPLMPYFETISLGREKSNDRTQEEQAELFSLCASECVSEHSVKADTKLYHSHKRQFRDLAERRKRKDILVADLREFNDSFVLFVIPKFWNDSNLRDRIWIIQLYSILAASLSSAIEQRNFVWFRLSAALGHNLKGAAKLIKKVLGESAGMATGLKAIALKNLEDISKYVDFYEELRELAKIRDKIRKRHANVVQLRADLDGVIRELAQSAALYDDERDAIGAVGYSLGQANSIPFVIDSSVLESCSFMYHDVMIPSIGIREAVQNIFRHYPYAHGRPDQRLPVFITISKSDCSEFVVVRFENPLLGTTPFFMNDILREFGSISDNTSKVTISFFQRYFLFNVLFGDCFRFQLPPSKAGLPAHKGVPYYWTELWLRIDSRS